MLARHAVVLVLVLCAISSATAQQQPPAKGPIEQRADSLLRVGDAKGAIATYREVLASDSTILRAWTGIGFASVRLADYAAAASAFERAAANPRNSAAMYNAGAMHSRLGHADEAFRWFDKAVAAGFAQVNLLTTDDDLANVRSDARFPDLVKRVRAIMEPCMSNPEARTFDFWIGEWTVHPVTTPAFQAGTSSVQRVSGGCALLENWTAAGGSEGKSLNAWNPATKQWQQFWVGQAGGITEYRESHWEGEKLVLFAKGPGSWQRLSFSPVDANTARQTGEMSNDEGKTWTPGYDFFYRRK